MHRSIITWTIIVAGSHYKVCYRLHTYTLQCYFQLLRWYDRKIFIPAQVYHIALPVFSLGTGFHKSVIVEPLRRPSKHFVNGSSQGLEQTTFSVPSILSNESTLNHSPTLRLLAAFESAWASRLWSISLSLIHLLDIHPSVLFASS